MGDALQEMKTKPTVSLSTWGAVVGAGRNTQYKLAAKGEIEGLIRVGNQYRVATAPWRKRLGLEAEAA